jgi:hypothetical protein
MTMPPDSGRAAGPSASARSQRTSSGPRSAPPPQTWQSSSYMALRCRMGRRRPNCGAVIGKLHARQWLEGRRVRARIDRDYVGAAAGRAHARCGSRRSSTHDSACPLSCLVTAPGARPPDLAWHSHAGLRQWRGARTGIARPACPATPPEAVAPRREQRHYRSCGTVRGSPGCRARERRGPRRSSRGTVQVSKDCRSRSRRRPTCPARHR